MTAEINGGGFGFDPDGKNLEQLENQDVQTDVLDNDKVLSTSAMLMFRSMIGLMSFTPINRNEAYRALLYVNLFNKCITEDLTKDEALEVVGELINKLYASGDFNEGKEILKKIQEGES